VARKQERPNPVPVPGRTGALDPAPRTPQVPGQGLPALRGSVRCVMAGLSQSLRHRSRLLQTADRLDAAAAHRAPPHGAMRR